MVARLVELALLIEGRVAAADMGVEGLTLGEGDGLAAVQTARGLLLHRVRLADGRVADYQIVAPTEWNFHPEGALVRGLVGIEARDDAGLVRSAQLVVQALDPCVACRVEVGHA
jgi:Ni,Fe-hydrogenase I large subunit